MDIETFGLDAEKEVKGVWKKLSQDSEVLVARANNPAFRKRFRELSEPYDTAIRNKVLDEETSKHLMLQATADTIFLGFKGIKEGGVALEDTVENRYKLLKDHSRFRDFIAMIAADEENYASQHEEEAVKNSSDDSSGTSKTAKMKSS